MRRGPQDWPSTLEAMWAKWRPTTADLGVHRLTGALIDLVTLLYRDQPEFDERCRGYVARALEAGRPAWSSAGRALWAVGLWRHGDEDSALLQLVLAELELQDELKSPRPDPVGGPLGPAAASNNLGEAYATLRMFELAEPHLQRAARLSEQMYAPALRLQVTVDYANLACVGVRWALHAESVGRANEARERAEMARRSARAFGVNARQQGLDDAERFARALMIGARSLASPSEVTAGDREALEEIAAAPFFGDDPTEVMVRTIQARVCRLTSDPQGCRDAAKRASALAQNGDQTLIAVALREAALLEMPDQFTWAYARAIAGQTESARRRAVAAFRTRLVLAGLEQRHQRVSEARQRLQRQLGDVTRGEADLVHAATHDELTGLPDRTLFIQRLDSALQSARESTSGLAVVLVDIDDLQEVNEKRGAAVGDQVLRWIGDRLQTSVRAADTVARLGDDEFAVLMVSQVSLPSVQSWADSLLDDLCDDRAETHEPHRVSVGVGVCLVQPGACLSPDQVMQEAQTVLDLAKRRRGGTASLMIATT